MRVIIKSIYSDVLLLVDIIPGGVSDTHKKEEKSGLDKSSPYRW